MEKSDEMGVHRGTLGSSPLRAIHVETSLSLEKTKIVLMKNKLSRVNVIYVNQKLHAHKTEICVL